MDKMLRQTDVAMSSFKEKLSQALAVTRFLSRIYNLGEKSLVAEGNKPLRGVPHPKIF